MSKDTSKGGSNRDWGYASYDVDKFNDYSDSNLQYTSYEKNGSVNKYSNTGDEGHSHDHFKSSDSYNKGGDPDYSRRESNGSPNPSIGEVQNNGGCYLTTACMIHTKEEFDDNCEELTILRWFRDNFVSKEDIKHYYITAPIIVESINEIQENKNIYDYIYKYIVSACVTAIKKGDYEFAYKRYKSSILALEEKFAKPKLTEKFIKVLKMKI